VQILINKEARKIAIRPCYEDGKDSLQWCRTNKHGKRVVKQIGARYFAAKLYDDFGWNTNCQIKMIATLVKAKDEQIYVFDLDSIGIYVSQLVEGGKAPRRVRVPYFPKEWGESYGKSVTEHDQILTRVDDLPDGFIVLKQTPSKSKKSTAPQLEMPLDEMKQTSTDDTSTSTITDNADNIPIPIDATEDDDNGTTE